MFDHCGALFGHLVAIWDTFGASLAEVPLTSDYRNAKPKKREKLFFVDCSSVFGFKGCDMLLFMAVVRMLLLADCWLLTGCGKDILRYEAQWG